jgi:hypothetical protein
MATEMEMTTTVAAVAATEFPSKDD